MRIGYLECFSGISGDMLLGALVDAGVSFDLLAETAVALHVGARLESRKVMRGGLTATKVDVITEEHADHMRHDHTHHDHDHSHDHHEHTHEHHSQEGHSHEAESHAAHEHRSHDHAHQEHHAHEHVHEERPAHEHSHGPVIDTQEHTHEHTHEHSHGHSHQHSHEHGHPAHRSLTTILGIIQAAHLSEPVKTRASRAFQLLGEAEAAIHSIPIEKVHFHEVGAVDTIVDIVCAAAGCEALGVSRWMASPLNVGSGTVKCQHGTLPVPAPATLALLGDAPVYAAGPPMERVTPTGAALLRMLDVQYGTLPAMRVHATGYGAGGRDTPGEPNLLRLLVGEESKSAIEADAAEPISVPIAVMETVIDDSNPQLLAWVSELLLAAGAWDVYRASVQMKKGRTGVQMTVLSSPDRLPALRELVFRETTTIGLRWRIENKLALEREFVTVSTACGDVRIKIARWPSGEVANASPEYEDCRKLATEHSIPLKDVMQAAMQAYASREKEGA